MIFDHAVKYNKVFYQTGENVPMSEAEEVKAISEQTAIQQEQAEFERQCNTKKSEYLVTINKSLSPQALN